MSLESNDPRAQAEAKSRYKMPTPSVGPCVWKPSPSGTDVLPAMITQIGSRSVTLCVFAPDNRGLLPYDGVRHISDPELADNPDRISGCWDFTPSDKCVADVAVEVAELKALVAS